MSEELTKVGKMGDSELVPTEFTIPVPWGHIAGKLKWITIKICAIYIVELRCSVAIDEIFVVFERVVRNKVYVVLFPSY